MLKLSRRLQSIYLGPINGIKKYTESVNKSENKKIDNSDDYTTVYKFPQIQGVAVVNQLKKLHTGVTAIVLPISLSLHWLDCLDIVWVKSVVMIGICGCVPLYATGYLANKLVGFVYLDPNETKVRLAYLDFWGRRKDVDLPIDDIIPFCDLPRSVTDVLYTKVKCYSGKHTYKINTKFGKIIDDNKFNKVFK